MHTLCLKFVTLVKKFFMKRTSSTAAGQLQLKIVCFSFACNADIVAPVTVAVAVADTAVSIAVLLLSSFNE